jgi:hypothetical protein
MENLNKHAMCKLKVEDQMLIYTHVLQKSSII